jgi:hypothetical protein
MLGNIQEALKRKNIVWRQHGFARMLERNLSRDDVFNVIQNGEIIEYYPEAKPYLGCLIAGISHNKRVHVVAAWDESAYAVYIITVYIPDEDHFHKNGLTRKVRK